MKHPLAETLRNPHFQAKTLMVILMLAWIAIGLMERNIHFFNLVVAPHAILAGLAFKRNKSVMDVLGFFVGMEAAFWVIFPILSGGHFVDFVRILFILLCGRTLYALYRASQLLQEQEAPHGFEPVMKPKPVKPENKP